MDKYAVVWTTNKGYMPGTNAILNALEYYGMDNIDKYVVYIWDIQELEQNYLQQWPNVNFVSMDTKYWHEKKNVYWWCIYSDILYSLDKLFNKYEVILFWSADICMLNDISVFFEIAEKTKKIILGTNEHGTHRLNKLSVSWPYVHTWSIPYADIPWFVPKEKKYFLETMIEYQKKDDCKLNRMDAINYAVRDLDEDIITTPGELWIQNVPYRIPLCESNNEYYFKGSSTRLNSFHRKYWIVNYIKNYIRDGNDIAKNNVKLFNKAWNFFNKDCRVKWNEGVETWDGML